jgi:hypothetical protein
MAGVLSEESGVGKSAEGISRGQHSTGEALAEWRSSEQVENGIASTSPPYWDTDEDDGGKFIFPLFSLYTIRLNFPFFPLCTNSIQFLFLFYCVFVYVFLSEL